MYVSRTYADSRRQRVHQSIRVTDAVCHLDFLGRFTVGGCLLLHPGSYAPAET
jgi:hypothetical protein